MNTTECGINVESLERWILTYYTKEKPTSINRIRGVIDFSFDGKLLFYQTFADCGTIDIATLNYLSIRPETMTYLN